MSFASMHNDYLDPDRAGLNDENWGIEFDAIEKGLKEHDTGRWDWEKITCCTTSKDADLTPWGCQGIELVSVNEDAVTVVIHGYKTFVGDDICLNEPKGYTDEQVDTARQLYLDQAELIVQGCGSAGEWDGDSWIMAFEEEVKIPWAFNEDMTPDYDTTVKSILEAAETLISPWETEIELADGMLDQLAGWKDSKGNRCQEGEPDMHCSIFPLYWKDSK